MDLSIWTKLNVSTLIAGLPQINIMPTLIEPTEIKVERFVQARLVMDYLEEEETKFYRLVGQVALGIPLETLSAMRLILARGLAIWIYFAAAKVFRQIESAA